MQLRDVTEATSPNPYEATQECRIFELQRELVKVGVIGAIEAL